MDEQDRFAVWVADGLLRTRDDEFGAESLTHLFEEATDSEDFAAKLTEASAQEQQPGDFGLEFIGPLLPVLFIEFGRLLWQTYSKELAEKGGKAAAGWTIDAVKSLFKKKVATQEGLSQAETQLRAAALKSGLNAAQADALLETLHDPKLAQTLVGA